MLRVVLEFETELDHRRTMSEPGFDSGAFDAEVQRTRASMVAWFRRRIADAAEAEDLAQESYLRIAQRGGQTPVDHFEAYLYQTARSVLADRHRRRTARNADAHVPIKPEHEPTDETDALRAMLAKEKLQRASKILMAMPERTRSIFILCRLEGLRYAEVATRFNISVSAVQKQMLKAIETLLLATEDEA